VRQGTRGAGSGRGDAVDGALEESPAYDPLRDPAAQLPRLAGAVGRQPAAGRARTQPVQLGLDRGPRDDLLADPGGDRGSAGHRPVHRRGGSTVSRTESV
jgi:hypothetical protein